MFHFNRASRFFRSAGETVLESVDPAVAPSPFIPLPVFPDGLQPENRSTKHRQRNLHNVFMEVYYLNYALGPQIESVKGDYQSRQINLLTIKASVSGQRARNEYRPRSPARCSGVIG